MMALPKLAASQAACRTLVGAHSFMLGEVAWHSRPAVVQHSARSLSSSSRRREQQQQQQQRESEDQQSSPSSSQSTSSQPPSSARSSTSTPTDTSNDIHSSLPSGWEDDPQFSNITQFSDLPHRFFGYNQHIKINEDFKESLRQILWQFRAPIRYAFAYGSGVFGQANASPTAKKNPGLDAITNLSPHPDPPKAVKEWQKGGAKVIDFIFGVSHTQHWHSLNLTQHADHYSGLKYLPYSSAAISRIQDSFGAGVYFNPYITVNGVMIKYGVCTLDTLATDLSEWRTLYLAGRLQKPVKILRDDPRIRLANQLNLLSALRTALLMLPERFTERALYERIAGLSYMGDPRMLRIPLLGTGENTAKVSNIVGAQLPGFRQLYVPLIENLANVSFDDSRKPAELAWEKEDAIRHTGSNVELDEQVLGGKDGLMLEQDMDPRVRGGIVRRLPEAFRRKVYYQYKKEFQIPGSAWGDILSNAEYETQEEKRTSGGGAASSIEVAAGDKEDKASMGDQGVKTAGAFERRIAEQGVGELEDVLARCVRGTVQWPATSQTIKSFFTAGIGKAWRYYRDKRKRGKEAVVVEEESKEDGEGEKVGEEKVEEGKK